MNKPITTGATLRSLDKLYLIAKSLNNKQSSILLSVNSAFLSVFSEPFKYGCGKANKIKLTKKGELTVKPFAITLSKTPFAKMGERTVKRFIGKCQKTCLKGWVDCAYPLPPMVVKSSHQRLKNDTCQLLRCEQLNNHQWWGLGGAL